MPLDTKHAATNRFRTRIVGLARLIEQSFARSVDEYYLTLLAIIGICNSLPIKVRRCMLAFPSVANGRKTPSGSLSSSDTACRFFFRSNRKACSLVHYQSMADARLIYASSTECRRSRRTSSQRARYWRAQASTHRGFIKMSQRDALGLPYPAPCPAFTLIDSIFSNMSTVPTISLRDFESRRPDIIKELLDASTNVGFL